MTDKKFKEGDRVKCDRPHGATYTVREVVNAIDLHGLGVKASYIVEGKYAKNLLIRPEDVQFFTKVRTIEDIVQEAVEDWRAHFNNCCASNTNDNMVAAIILAAIEEASDCQR